MIGPGTSAIGYHRFIAVRQTGGKRSEAESGKLKARQIVEELRVEKRKDGRSGSVLGLSFRRIRNGAADDVESQVFQLFESGCSLGKAGRLLRNLKARPRLRLRYGLRTHVERSGLRGEKQNDIIKRRGYGVPHYCHTSNEA